MKINKILAVSLFLSALAVSPPPIFCRTKISAPNFSAAVQQTKKFIRTELYFGTNKPDGTSVSDEDWTKFLAAYVTPRFPDGFTVLKGYGQFKDARGEIVREESRIIEILYEKKKRRPANEKIEEIRAEYKKRFQQESVLRMDFLKSVRVSF